MDELHAAIVAYLRRHRLLRAVLREHEVAIRAFRHDRGVGVYGLLPGHLREMSDG